MSRFLLVDDHSIIRVSLKYLIREEFKNAEIFEASDGESALNKVKRSRFDLIILDIHMPDTGINDLILNLMKMHHRTKILVFTMSDDSTFAKHFFRLGACGFLSKNASESEIVTAIHDVLKGKQYMSRALTVTLANEVVEQRGLNPFNALSEREFEVFVLMIRGKSLSEIAEILNLHISTTATHKGRLFGKLQVNNIVDLMQLAREHNVWP